MQISYNSFEKLWVFKICRLLFYGKQFEQYLLFLMKIKCPRDDILVYLASSLSFGIWIIKDIKFCYKQMFMILTCFLSVSVK